MSHSHPWTLSPGQTPADRGEAESGSPSLSVTGPGPVTSQPEDWRPSDAMESPERLGHHRSSGNDQGESGEQPTRR